MRAFLAFAFSLSLAACTASHSVKRTESRGVSLDPDGYAYVMTPENGRYGDTVYNESGRQTALAVSRAFSPHLRLTKREIAVTDRASALKAAKAGGFTYVIQPQILHWEDRATQWSGLLDKIELRLYVVDVATGKVLDSVLIDAKSKWATLGGDHPEHLLEQPLTDYANSLFP